MSHPAAPLDSQKPARPAPQGSGRSTRADDDRPPQCPACNRRLVILSTHLDTSPDGQRQRYQLWGCPRGHATSRRIAGTFLPVELLPDP